MANHLYCKSNKERITMYTVTYKYYSAYTKERKFDTYAAAKKFFYYASFKMNGVTNVLLK